MTALEALDDLINEFGSQAAVVKLLGRKEGSTLKKNGVVASKVLEQQIIALWEKQKDPGKKTGLLSSATSASRSRKRSALGNNQLGPSNGADSFISAAIAPPKPSKSVPLILYYSKFNPPSSKIRQFLEKNKIDYEAVRVKLGSKQAKKIKTRLGQVTVPILQHGEQWFDSVELISTYLKELYPEIVKPGLIENIVGKILPRKKEEEV